MRSVVAAVILAAAVHASVWFAIHERSAPPDTDASFRSLSYSPYRPGQDPNAGDVPTIQQMDEDLQQMAAYTRTVRTYSTTGGPESVPALARRHGMNVTVGAWVDRDEDRSRREIEMAVDLARTNRNVKAVLVGNEMLYRADRTAEEVIAMIRQVKKRVKVPVSTGEIWNMWLEHPELVNEVDFIAVHILPYWEHVPAEKTVAYALERYQQLRKAYPGKRIVIAEFGWPSQGSNKVDAMPDPLIQAAVLREFMVEAKKRGIDYNIVEAYDQPWKDFEGGGVGQYWGIFNAERHLKFPLAGTVEQSTDHYLGAGSLILGALLTIFGLARRRPRLGHAVAYAAAANAMAVGVVLVGAYPFLNYMNFGIWVMWSMGCGLLLPLAAISLSKVHEIAAVVLGHRPARLITADAPRPVGARLPKVSIHIPAYREPPEMLKATLDAVAALDYPDFEALVIINNTPEEHYWGPVKEHCERLGERFKFIYLPKVAGFKAGAMNAAYAATAPDAEVLAVIDADYVVHRDWLKDLVPYFADPKVGFIQAPQDHRDGRESLLKRMMKWEYDGFFDIGMVQRNEENAIIAHGTMLLVRRSAFDQVGGWSTDTIVEDTELGLKLYEAGYISHYTNTRYGWGVLPDTYQAFKVQRHRWAYGAVQIFKKHRYHMLPGQTTLTPAQKAQYLTGWFYWLSDAVGTAMALLSLVWVPIVLLVGVALPTALTAPLLAAFVINVAHGVLLYRTRVKAGLLDTLCAAVAAMSLQLTVARAVFDGFIKDNMPFRRTDKGGNAKKKAGESPALAETIIGVLLVAGSAAVHATNHDQATNMTVFAATLAVQAVPFLAATVMRTVERGQDGLKALRRPRQTTGAIEPVPAQSSLGSADLQTGTPPMAPS